MNASLVLSGGPSSLTPVAPSSSSFSMSPPLPVSRSKDLEVMPWVWEEKGVDQLLFDFA